ncbi:ABC transporter permease [Staphylococcus ratti]|uniref:FtsX-like permease family protein n=1 Tax=Staphylococcus ratti TaxID=2892440 RepID=A0ABY3PBB0_9STAP|nr:ABC transporter permease [Staphylococcus ratti]UEX89564.1 FtsX-like permease family protein [Staphylococcus ratti]
MKHYKIFKDVIKLLKRNKRQSILTSIAIGIATFVVLIVLSSQTYTFNSLSEGLNIDKNTTSLTFTPHNKLDLEGFTDKDRSLIEKEIGFQPKLISSSYGKVIPTEFQQQRQNLSFRTEDNLSENQVGLPEVLMGKKIQETTKANQIAISDKALKRLSRNDNIQRYLGETLTIGKQQYKIDTIYQSSAVKEVLPDLILSNKTEQQLLKNHIFYDQMDVSTNESGTIYKMLAILDEHGVNKEKGTYDFIDNVQVYEDTKNETNTILNFIAILSSISIFVAGFGVMNAMFSTVNERSKEIAIRRALGAKKSQIYMSYLIEGTLLSTIGGLIGVAAALVFIILMNLSGMVATVSVMQVIITLVINACLGVVFSILPAMVAANKNVIEGMK